jgi:hypothetical protein
MFDLELNTANLKAIFSETFYEKYIPHNAFHKKNAYCSRHTKPYALTVIMQYYCRHLD